MSQPNTAPDTPGGGRTATRFPLYLTLAGVFVTIFVVFDLFLTSGVFRKYGEAYLRPEQVDEVEIGDYLG